MTDTPPFTGIKRKSVARLAAVQSLYSDTVLENEKSPEELVEDILAIYDTPEYHLEDGPPVEDPYDTPVPPHAGFLKALVLGTLEHLDSIDPKIIEFTNKSREFDQINTIIKAILRVGSFELMFEPETPLKVIIDEYMDITHALLSDKEAKFVNGTLDAIGHSVRN